MVAMMAKSRNIPVVVCCETYKFAEGIRWDGVSKNELGEQPLGTVLRALLRHAQRRLHSHRPRHWVVTHTSHDRTSQF